MSTTQNGFLLIADITGYTAYLSHSELEHAQDSLSSLLGVLLEQTKLPLVLSRLEGDAVISYALEDSFLQGQTLVELIEATYIAFRRALELMILNTTCDCQACILLPNLDLKFFIHYGTFMLQEFPAYTELIGTDVNLVHRLTKNSVTKDTGFKAYILYSQAATDALGIPDLTTQMTAHTENYEHIGEVKTYAQDMHPLWELARSQQDIAVKPEVAMFVMEHDFPVNLVNLWDFLTAPEFFAMITGSTSAKVFNKNNGRIGIRTAYQCVHGKNVTLQTVVDWQPHDQFTFESAYPGEITSLVTIQLTPLAEGTKAVFLYGHARGKPIFARIFWEIFFRIFYFLRGKTYRDNLQSIHESIEDEIASGIVVRSTSSTIPAEEVEKAVSESLASR